jgi:hypothetical protein
MVTAIIIFIPLSLSSSSVPSGELMAATGAVQGMWSCLHLYLFTGSPPCQLPSTILSFAIDSLGTMVLGLGSCLLARHSTT